MGLPEVTPLARIDSLRQYDWPDPDDERICGNIYRLADAFSGGDRFLAGSHRDTLWEKAYLIGFHSCGAVESAIETFVQLGVDVLNPVQATANDLDGIRSRTQGRMALRGGVSSATIMDGPVERIAAEVRERIWQLGRDGGYFCCQDQDLPFPEPHIDALHQAVEEYGQYPLHPPDEQSRVLSD
jgi:hypothetical protein